ncbi:bifunctional phosphoribosyl-AMP cyclohydrolase/phosphoribosyl-ATP diphosphatase HisIE [Paenibacillus taiwanensis]|uniref:bifunctional phosphoribosyl-AMP cyclohydrolase/phosphoribosyl-ATP diphosphatase HisIE n=1 Tax=Paenibacillus taiwanensis TaxID=401638 RepID=UPI0004117A6A|nr:bifunctional phosphoribosyl-AMP cyclohydrolase/phosphoribosyl-ATP diphosphatase HisIE [Paenibacillus taiwanensis]
MNEGTLQSAPWASWSDTEVQRIADSLNWNDQGLIPTIVQDASNQKVLMMAYMNRESLKLTCELGETVFWSRSRQAIWHKGATSGHTQRVVAMTTDCDKDTLLVQVVPNGPACHTGSETCFFENIGGEPSEYGGRFEVLAALENTIAERQRERPVDAYTTYLFDKGIDKILKKIGEESAEVIIAAKNNDLSELTGELGDLLFHMLVLMRASGLPFDQVLEELQRRHQSPRRDKYTEVGKIK